MVIFHGKLLNNHLLIAWWIFPWQTVSHNQMVHDNITLLFRTNLRMRPQNPDLRLNQAFFGHALQGSDGGTAVEVPGDILWQHSNGKTW